MLPVEPADGGRDPRLRACDADRDRVAESLREHHAVGRLSLEEFQQRLDATYRAKTYGELDAQTVDLPPAGGPLLPDQQRPAGTGHRRSRTHSYLSVNAICWAIWGASVATSGGHSLQGLWPIWVSLPWGAALITRRGGHQPPRG